MINAEKYKDEILEVMNNGRDFSVNEQNNKIKMCCVTNCAECLFNIRKTSCSSAMTKWLLSEYKAPIKLSRLEYEFLKWIENEGYKYIVRDRENNLFIFKEAPTKHRNYWVSKSGYNPISLFNNLFQFIKWEDSTPTLIKDVLENCEVVNDAEE